MPALSTCVPRWHAHCVVVIASSVNHFPSNWVSNGITGIWNLNHVDSWWTSCSERSHPCVPLMTFLTLTILICIYVCVLLMQGRRRLAPLEASMKGISACIWNNMMLPTCIRVKLWSDAMLFGYWLFSIIIRFFKWSWLYDISTVSFGDGGINAPKATASEISCIRCTWIILHCRWRLLLGNWFIILWILCWVKIRRHLCWAIIRNAAALELVNVWSGPNTVVLGGPRDVNASNSHSVLCKIKWNWYASYHDAMTKVWYAVVQTHLSDYSKMSNVKRLSCLYCNTMHVKIQKLNYSCMLLPFHSRHLDQISIVKWPWLFSTLFFPTSCICRW